MGHGEGQGEGQGEGSGDWHHGLFGCFASPKNCKDNLNSYNFVEVYVYRPIINKNLT